MINFSIQYDPGGKHQAHAAFLKGSDSKSWLQEISTWGIIPQELECYVIAKSKEDVSAAGLLVVFENAAITENLELLEPFQKIGSNLFIPVHSRIYPRLLPEELAQLMIWDLQVFHPVFGFSGFDFSDKIELEDLIFFPTTGETDWTFAHPGLPERPQFNRIDFRVETATEVIDTIKNEIGQKPLNDIVKDKKDDDSFIGRIFDSLKYYLGLALIRIIESIGKLLPESSGSSNEEGLLDKLYRWVSKNVKDLESKRDRELNRLLKLFDENKDEALQYALPLSSPYLNRGKATPTASLSRRSTNFDLSRLGGGGAVDAWDVGNYYQNLRNKYLETARQKTAEGDYRKAAYIYAHLLGDYQSAANVLQQGKLYREAASIYKDHLKDLPASAACLESGGLYTEAISIYLDLERYEKVGDLYSILGMKEKADGYYQQQVDQKLGANDYLDAARISSEKLLQKDTASSLLLKGWNSGYQIETCLYQYFEMVQAQKKDTTKELVSIYQHHTPVQRRQNFINVLERLHRKIDEPLFTDAAQEIAYELASKEMDEGRAGAIKSLKSFLPNDSLLASEINRFVIQNAKAKAVTRSKNFIQLDPSIVWQSATYHRNQFLVLGKKNENLYMVRSNWYGNMELYTWENKISQGSGFSFLETPQYSNLVLIHATNNIPLTTKQLPKSKYFEDIITVRSPLWMHKDYQPSIVDGNNIIWRLVSGSGKLELHFLNLEGTTQSIIDLKVPDEVKFYFSEYSILRYRNNILYTSHSNYLLSITKDGSVQECIFDRPIRFFSLGPERESDFWMIVITNEGWFTCRVSGQKIEIVTQISGQERIPEIVSFISAMRFAIVVENEVSLFEIDSNQPQLLNEYKLTSKVVEVLPTNSRNQFGIIESNGRVNLIALED